jgi:hypothetical protein
MHARNVLQTTSQTELDKFAQNATMAGLVFVENHTFCTRNNNNAKYCIRVWILLIIHVAEVDRVVIIGQFNAPTFCVFLNLSKNSTKRLLPTTIENSIVPEEARRPVQSY